MATGELPTCPLAQNLTDQNSLLSQQQVIQITNRPHEQSKARKHIKVKQTKINGGFGDQGSFACSSSPVFWRLVEGSSSLIPSGSGAGLSVTAPFPPSWLTAPFRILLIASGPKRETCLLVIFRPALTFGPQCRSGFGRNRFTFFIWALLRAAPALEKSAYKNKQKRNFKILSCHVLQEKKKHIRSIVSSMLNRGTYF